MNEIFGGRVELDARRCCDGMFWHRSAVFCKQFSHVRLAQCHGNSVDSDLNTRSHSLRLEIVLCSEFAGAFGDCNLHVNVVSSVYGRGTCSRAVDCQSELVSAQL